MRYGYLDSLDLLNSILSEHERNIINGVLKSISLVCDSMEVSYIQNSQPVNLFAKLVGKAVTASCRNTRVITRYPQFRIFLQEAGVIRNLEDIYRTGKADKVNYYADVVVRMFSFADETSLKKKALPDDMYKDLENWANNYIAMGIRYLQNKELARIILSDQIVEDNAAVIIKTITLLNRRMTLLGMKYNMGTVLPAYKI